ncbi:hypothetical protein FRUB_02688 [Fimbriiglobus ruber]|uniref:Lipoprotein n=1 Tax=Fimbriiglobus ruber TaxID=1908690 RepID=A0A225E0S2_9BACT|nr:hypothetical protein FRUB_02688 [Fimbriiglobus ruber]
MQARGPVHEAYAEPTGAAPAPGTVAPQAPPADINEVPPDQRPEGDNVQWIPGYWAWDDDSHGYIWVSGFWRIPPPARRWLPGHWQAIDGGWQWVAGFWAPDDLTQVQYLPAPPPLPDQPAPPPAPDPNSVYVPGIWVYQQAQYMWRPGFWVPFRPGWVWSPANYVWTPNGCLFFEGYWDRPLGERGLLFAPVRFGPAWRGGAFVPSFVVNTDFLLGALFVRTAAHHFYFGDYFDKGYANRGFVAWPDYRIGRVGFDPNFSYYRHLYTGHPEWEKNLHELYHARAAGTIARPPRTWNQQVQAVRTLPGNRTAFVHNDIHVTHVENVSVLSPLAQAHNVHVTGLAGLARTPVANVPAHVVKLEPVTRDVHAREVQAAAQLRESAALRRNTEAKVLSSGGPRPLLHTDPPHVAALNLPKPIPHVEVPRPGPVVAPRVAPPIPVMPQHEVRAIPKFEPHPLPRPPIPVKR